MTDLESPRKNNDCYFYYYSTCAKGDSCTFRHEPSALGCETMCSFWKEGKCLNVHCNFRHMELRKNRKAIPCYWESQPSGCKKQHCPFMHQAVKDASSPPPPSDLQQPSEETEIRIASESTDDTMTGKYSQMDDNKHFQKPNDSLVVNFEEESDTESASTTNSPIKPTNNRTIKVKTLEEIKLEKIQAEQAAFFSYQPPDSEDLRQRIIERISTKNYPKIEQQPTKKPMKNVNDIKIKTLDEIRAERALKQQLCDNSVTSTCSVDEQQQNDSKKRGVEEEQTQDPPKKKLKLQRPPLQIQAQQQEEEQPVMEPQIDDKIEQHPQLLEEKAVNDEDIDDNEDVNEDIEDDTNKMEEVLLLQDDDDASNVSLKEEDELLNEIDNLLED